jgi:aquaporin Z
MKAAFLHFAGWRSRGTRTSQSYRSGARTTHTTVTLEARNGWHWKEWLAEGAGTAILLFAVVTAKDLAVRAGPPLSSLPWRNLIAALVAGATVGVVAVSAMGRRSGAHLNPALTFGLWLQRTVSSADLAGYLVAQVSGAVAGVAVARLWGPSVTRAPVDWAVVKPASLIPHPGAAGLECGAVLVQLSVVFILLSSQRLHQRAPAASGALLAAAVFVLAPLSGGGINPARALALTTWRVRIPASGSTSSVRCWEPLWLPPR